MQFSDIDRESSRVEEGSERNDSSCKLCDWLTWINRKETKLFLERLSITRFEAKEELSNLFLRGQEEGIEANTMNHVIRLQEEIHTITKIFILLEDLLEARNGKND